MLIGIFGKDDQDVPLNVPFRTLPVSLIVDTQDWLDWVIIKVPASHSHAARAMIETGGSWEFFAV